RSVQSSRSRRHCSISARLACDGSEGAFLANLIEVGCEGDEAGPPTRRLKAAELRKGRGTTTGSPVPPGQWMLRTAGPNSKLHLRAGRNSATVPHSYFASVTNAQSGTCLSIGDLQTRRAREQCVNERL